MLWDLIQQAQIGQIKWKAQEAKTTAKDAQHETRILQNRTQSLEENLERLSLASMAIAEILCTRFGVTREEFESKVQEIDLRDGKLDGRLRLAAIDCLHCHHKNSAHRCRCLYCGETLPTGCGLFVAPSEVQNRDV